MSELNNDQIRIMLALNNPHQFFHGEGTEHLVKGATYRQLMEVTELSLEKTLLSLGWLEALGYVWHEVGYIQPILYAPGAERGVTLAHQEITRIFYLTKKGKEKVQELLKKTENENNP